MDSFSNTPSWLDERVRTYMDDTRAPRQRDPNRAKWYGPGQSVTVQDFEIKNAMIYVGDRLNAVENWFGGTEPALVNPRLRIAQSAVARRNPLGYRMSYANLSQETRGAFLVWLSDGRRDPEIGVDYVRLFLFGLERRVIHDIHQNFDKPDEPKLRKELIAIRDELYGLAKTYGHYTDTVVHLRELLTVVRTLLEDYELPATLPPQYSPRWTTPEDLRFNLGIFALNDRPIPALWAWKWLQSWQGARFRTPSKRVPAEFERLFEIRYTEQFGGGLEVPHGRHRLMVRYRPDTWSMLGMFDFPTPLPDVAAQESTLDKLQDLATECEHELDAFSRFVGKNIGDKASGLGARALLPSVLIDPNDKSIAALKKVLDGAAKSDSIATVDGRALVELWSPGSPQLTKGDSGALINVISAFDLAVVPDTRYGGKAIGSHPVVVYRGKAEIKVGTDYAPALAFAQIATSVMTSNKSINAADRLRLIKALDSGWSLSEDEIARLEASIEFFAVSDAKLNGVKGALRNFGFDEKAWSELLIKVCVPQANVTPSVMTGLDRAFKILDVDEENLYQSVHSRTSGSRGSSDGKPFSIDHSRVAATMAESHRVGELLGEIFQEEQVAKPAAATAVDLVEGLDAAHSQLLRALVVQEHWSAADFAALCARFNLLVSGAIDTLNEVAFDRVGDPVIDDAGIDIDLQVAEELF